jgi:uncharacterized integral membrane protein (TIGR00697 family)
MTPLPSAQHQYHGLPQLDERTLHDRRECVFLLLAAVFLGSLAMLNIIGITRFLDLSFTFLGVHVPFTVPVGVLPYPITFLCTDFISELYGRRRANQLVWAGFMVNIWVLLILWAGGAAPGTTAESYPPTGAFMTVRSLAFGAVTASMIAYLTAQFVDVYLFHFWKDLTHGRHLWLRNNGSTMVSQIVDTVCVILITHFFAARLPINPKLPEWQGLALLIFNAYVFKFVFAALDTIPFYILSLWLYRYLRVPPPTHGHLRHAEPG